MISVYLQRGSDKTLTKINDTMPHTWIVWGIYARIVHSRIAIQEMSAVRYPTVLKTSTFSIKDCEKHFQYVCYSIRIALQN